MKLKTETYKHQEDKNQQKIIKGAVIGNYQTAKPLANDRLAAWEKEKGLQGSTTESPDKNVFSPGVNGDTIVAQPQTNQVKDNAIDQSAIKNRSSMSPLLKTTDVKITKDGDFDGVNVEEENMSEGDAKSDRSWSGQRKKEEENEEEADEKEDETDP